ncbi:hypothetical protein LXD69_04880 [Flavobacterium sediminilitoris]|uniref:Uncharacterized protein n=1 Tax=Flavobacterium sediminilitoris TaxID=2024526 RepID=A0ABY4HRK9_9FLAO|nr:MULTISPECIES: hypothetical protein [Flavobacterium]UOX34846.1 hypothetical protein LXD69_04880 [Flavobacterium sediminilitoris]
MAKSNGILKIEGTIEDLTFYKKDGKNFVRRKGGVSRERILNDPSFIRTRENGAEFSHSASAGKLLRLALGGLVFKAKDSKLSSRMLQLMSKIKNLDTVSLRGQRKVSEGVSTAQGKQILKGFDFNANAPLNNVLFAPFVFESANGVISFTDFIPAEQLQFPQGATHFSMQSVVLHLDFETGESEIGYSNVVNLPISFTPNASVLTPASVPTGNGCQLFLMLISFYQELNGVQYSLKNEEFNVLSIIEVL